MSQTKRKPRKPRKQRMIDRLRRHEAIGGNWRWSREDGYVRADGMRLYGYSECSISAGGTESYRSIYSVEKPGEAAMRVYDLDGKWWTE